MNFDALHLFEVDVNWLGRTTKRTDGSVPADAQKLRENLRKMLKTRRKFGKYDNRRFVQGGGLGAGTPTGMSRAVMRRVCRASVR